LVLAPIVRS